MGPQSRRRLLHLEIRNHPSWQQRPEYPKILGISEQSLVSKFLGDFLTTATNAITTTILTASFIFPAFKLRTAWLFCLDKSFYNGLLKSKASPLSTSPIDIDYVIPTALWFPRVMRLVINLWFQVIQGPGFDRKLRYFPYILM